jgi:hypothetical protein
MDITPKEKIKRTWILDIGFFYPGCLWWPLTPWWGNVSLDAKLLITVPDKINSLIQFTSEAPVKIYFYPYYKAGKIITKSYLTAYRSLFEQIGKYDFTNPEILANQDLIIARNNALKNKLKNITDVDDNIPVNSELNNKTFAVIIGNESYAKEIRVNYALNDARIFRQYMQKTLCLPDNNIYYSENATYGQILDALKWMNDVIKAFNGEASVIFYYAGHGMPDEQTKSAYLLPVDGNSQNPSTAVSLADVYSKITEYPSEHAIVFLDACFSGSTRETDGTMLAQGRGVRIAPKTEVLPGSLIVFSAATGDETAFPFTEKRHGLFSYYLLKKLQDSKGTATLNDISNYIITNVRQQSVVVNKKSQNPQVNVSPKLQSIWQTISLK